MTNLAAGYISLALFNPLGGEPAVWREVNQSACQENLAAEGGSEQYLKGYRHHSLMAPSVIIPIHAYSVVSCDRQNNNGSGSHESKDTHALGPCGPRTEETGVLEQALTDQVFNEAITAMLSAERLFQELFESGDKLLESGDVPSVWDGGLFFEKGGEASDLTSTSSLLRATVLTPKIVQAEPMPSRNSQHADQLLLEMLAIPPELTKIALRSTSAIASTGPTSTVPESDQTLIGTPQLDRQAVLNGYRQLPLRFEANTGQTDPQFQFVSRGTGYNLRLSPTAADLLLTNPSSQPVGASGDHPPVLLGTMLRMQFIGANPSAQAVGVGELATRTNYLFGDDPSQWHIDIPNYTAVKYQNVYDGVDVVYYGNDHNQLEYDIVVDAGANPSAVTLGFEGVDQISLNDQGDLVLHTSIGQITQSRPYIYQEAHSIRNRIAGEYVLIGGNRVGFAVGAYDASKPLVIDPVFGSLAPGAPVASSTYLGGSDRDDGLGVAVDDTGVYVTGFTASNDFPTTAGAFQANLTGGEDVFVTKLNPSLTEVVYSTYLGGDDNDYGNAIAVENGEAYVTGETSSANFPTTAGAVQVALGGARDAFVTKLNAAGNNLVYSTFLGGTDTDAGHGVAVTGGRAYVTGYTYSPNFPTTAGAYQVAIQNQDAFVTQVNAAGNNLVYSTFLGGASNDQGFGIAVEGGEAYIVGTTLSNNFPTSAGAFQAARAGSQDVFVTKMNAAGNNIVYSTYLGGADPDDGKAIAVADGYAYVTGDTQSNNFPTTGAAFQNGFGGLQDAFVTKVNRQGTALVYSSYLGGEDRDTGRGITLANGLIAYVTGETLSGDFPVTEGADQTNIGGGWDAYMAKVDEAGAALYYSTFLGGSGDDGGTAIAYGDPGAYSTGYTDSTDFPTWPGAYQPNHAGMNDAFITVFGI